MKDEKKKTKYDGYYLHTLDQPTFNVVYNAKKEEGRHDMDLVEITPKDYTKRKAWRISLDLLSGLVSVKNNWSLKYELFREDSYGNVIRFEFPTRRKALKLVLPLVPMTGNIEAAEKEVVYLSRRDSSELVKLVPVYLALNLLNPTHNKELNRIHFCITMEMLLRGTYDEIWVYGEGELPDGMKAIIRFCKAIGVKIVGKSDAVKINLAAFYRA